MPTIIRCDYLAFVRGKCIIILIQMSLESSVRECDLLKRELETVTQIKNNIILELERSLGKTELLNRRQEEIITELQAELRTVREKNKELELFSRERSHALTHKNIRIAQLEDELETKVKHEVEKWRTEVQVLKTIISDQEVEISAYLEDHHNYLRELERLQEPYRYLHVERKLLLDYNQQLEGQINQAEEAGVQLEQWAIKANEQLQHQNEQGNDLLGQVEYMIEQVAH